MEEEIWVPTVFWLKGKKYDFTGFYESSSLGRIRSLDREVKHNYGGTALKKGKVLVPHTHYPRKEGKPRQQIGLSREGKVIYPVLSRCIWESFNGEIQGNLQVNHIDEDPLNNKLENLNLMTPKENTNWGTCITRRAKTMSETRKGTELYETNPNAKPILQYTPEGEFIKRWDCARYAIEELKLSQSSLSSHLHGKRCKSVGGFVWRFA